MLVMVVVVCWLPTFLRGDGLRFNGDEAVASDTTGELPKCCISFYCRTRTPPHKAEGSGDGSSSTHFNPEPFTEPPIRSMAETKVTTSVSCIAISPEARIYIVVWNESTRCKHSRRVALVP